MNKAGRTKRKREQDCAADMLATNPHVAVIECESCEYQSVAARRVMFRKGQRLCPKCGGRLLLSHENTPIDAAKNKCVKCGKTLAALNSSTLCYACRE